MKPTESKLWWHPPQESEDNEIEVDTDFKRKPSKKYEEVLMNISDSSEIGIIRTPEDQRVRDEGELINHFW